MSTHKLCFEQNYEKYQNFLSQNFHFLVVKFSVYLNNDLFIMLSMLEKSYSRSLFEIFFFCLPENEL